MSSTPKQKQNVELAQKILKTCFAEQRAFILDTSRQKVAICSRRAAKTYAVGVQMVMLCLLHPNIRCLFLSLSAGSARRDFRDTVIRDMMARNTLPVEVKFNQILFPNGSSITMQGADVAASQLERLRGSKWNIVAIDEPASFTHSLEYLISNVVNLTTIETRGQVILIGTPGRILNTFFHKVCDGRIAGWSVHKWSCLQNPHLAQQFAEEIKRKKKLNSNFEETPEYKREYCGEWILDDVDLVYNYTSENIIDVLPPEDFVGAPRHCMAVDLGYNDATAIVVGRWHKHDPTFYVVDAFKRSHLDLFDVAAEIKKRCKQWNITTVSIDTGGGGKQGVATLKRHLNINFIPAEKNDKHMHINMLNSDLNKRRIKILKEVSDPIIEEWGQLVFDAEAFKLGKLAEDPRCENHISDALMYAWRASKHYTGKMKQLVKPLSSEEIEEIRLNDEERKKWRGFDEDVISINDGMFTTIDDWN